MKIGARLSFAVVQLIVAATFASAAAANPNTPASPLNVIVGGTAVIVTNVARGGEVLLFSCAKRIRDGANYLETNARRLRDTDGDGTVSFDTPVPLRSVWIAIDDTTGATGAGAPEDFPLLVRQIAPSLLKKDADGEVATLEQEIPRVVLLLVRPRAGAWLKHGRDGSDGDADGDANGRLVFTFDDATAVAEGKENAPKRLKSGDVIVAVDPGRLDVFLGEVTK